MGDELKRGARCTVFAALLLSYAYFFQGGGWNPNSRLDLTRALAAGHGFRIDAYYNNTGDWAYHGGHYYTNKSPGLSLISWPAFSLGQYLARLALHQESAAALVISAYLANLTSNALPAAMLGLLLFETLTRLALARVSTCAWLALTFGLGTLAFPYSTAYYGHQPASTLGFAAFFLLNRAEDNPHRRNLVEVAAGAAMGAAISIELSTIITAAALVTVTLASKRRQQSLLWFLAGAAPMLLGLACYHYVCFGHPLATGYTYSNPAVMTREEGRLFGFPKVSRLVALLVSPSRGLLFSSPVLALAAIGVRDLIRANRRQAAVCIMVTLGYLLFFASFHGWRGGWAPGPRYLVPCLPFLFVAAAFSLRRLPRLFSLLAATSILFMLLITTVGVEVPAGLPNPLADFTLRWLSLGKVSVNPQGLNDYLPPVEYLRFQPVDNWNSFNLGELLFPHSVMSLLPLLVIWALLAATLRQMAHPRA